MDDTDKMCVYEGYNKARDCRQETLVKYEAHRYLSTNEWINAALVLHSGLPVGLPHQRMYENRFLILFLLVLVPEQVVLEVKLLRHQSV